MRNTATKPQIPIEPGRSNSGLDHVQRSEELGKVGEKEELRAARKRVKFDKGGHSLVRQGHQFRKDHLKINKIHAALKGITQQELINKALEYYKANVLNKTEAQKLKEAGQEELDI